ncbi:MAG: sugar ABC transporter permease [Armatimonadetes bacterium]|nr:sugar ABC transporter permease [Armatimonadota bacterium]
MRRDGRTTFIITFLAPAVSLYGVFVLWPLLQSFVLSLYRWRGVSAKKTYVGLENFQALTRDDVLWQALKNNLWLLVVGGLAVLVIGVTIAHAMQGSGWMARALRGVYLFPQVISLVVVAILWMFLYNPSFGLITSGLNAIGLGDLARPWLGDSKTALPSVGIAFLWYVLGFYIMLFAAGIKSIPSEIHEAAALDGSAGLSKFWKVTWPMLWSVKRVAVVYIVINVMNVFALVYLMTQGGPDRKTEVMLTYLYEQAFKNNQFGYATALAVGVFVVSMALCLILMFLFRKNPEEARV